MSVLGRLAEIEQRAVFHKPGAEDSRADVPKLVAALRAVLGNHWRIEGGEECGYDGRFWPCPDYRAITEALGDGA